MDEEHHPHEEHIVICDLRLVGRGQVGVSPKTVRLSGPQGAMKVSIGS